MTRLRDKKRNSKLEIRNSGRGGKRKANPPAADEIRNSKFENRGGRRTRRTRRADTWVRPYEPRLFPTESVGPCLRQALPRHSG